MIIKECLFNESLHYEFLFYPYSLIHRPYIHINDVSNYKSRAIMVCITVFKVAMNKIIHLGNSTFEAVQNREIR